MRSEKIKIHLERKMTEREGIYPFKKSLTSATRLFFETTKLIPKELLPENLVCSVRKLDKWRANEEVTSLNKKVVKAMSRFDPPCNTIPSPKHQ